jgi:hypothetical protein
MLGNFQTSKKNSTGSFNLRRKQHNFPADDKRLPYGIYHIATEGRLIEVDRI